MAPWASCIWMGRLIKSFRLAFQRRQAPALGQLETVIRQAFVEEVRMTALEDVVPFVVQQVGSMAPSYPVFVKFGRGTWLIGQLMSCQWHEWKTECGWTFGLADFAPVQVR